MCLYFLIFSLLLQFLLSHLEVCDTNQLFDFNLPFLYLFHVILFRKEHVPYVDFAIIPKKNCFLEIEIKECVNEKIKKVKKIT